MMAALVATELRKLQRERTIVVLAAALLTVLALVSVLASHAELRMYLFIAYVLVPLFTTASAAVLVSGDRQTGYAAVLHTAPVTPMAYLVAKFVAALVFSLFAIALTVPLLLLLALHAGAAALGTVVPYLGAGALLAVFGAALGLLISCSVGRRGLMPSAFAGLAAAFGLALAPVFLLFLPPSLAQVGLQLARLSPVVAIYEGAPPAPRDWATPAGLEGYALVGYFTAVMVAMGFVVYTKLQNADGWDAPRGAGIAAGLVAVVLMAAPLAALAPPTPEPADAGQAAAFPPAPGLGRVDVTLASLDGGPPAALAVGVPTTYRVVVERGPGSEEPLTNARLEFIPSGSALLRFDPPVLDLGTFPAPSACDPQARAPCGGFAARDAVVAVTLEQVPRLHGGPSSLRVRMVTDQGTAHGFVQVEFAPTGYAEWQSLAVGLGTLGLVAAPHALRQATLGRRAEPAGARPARPDPPSPPAAATTFTRLR
ncbi:MAG TPA: ABC transporter permease [Candidatus Thermoplasmatota archaeon]|jgi:hypothetical protein|nr:ABC transporter permease [Candidatus Thermoplasmatota archaeon]